MWVWPRGHSWLLPCYKLLWVGFWLSSDGQPDKSPFPVQMIFLTLFFLPNPNWVHLRLRMQLSARIIIFYAETAVYDWSTRPTHNITVVITVFTHVRPSVRPHFLKSRRTKQFSSENSYRYWQDCGPGRRDHWWHLSCVESGAARLNIT